MYLKQVLVERVAAAALPHHPLARLQRPQVLTPLVLPTTLLVDLTI